jgi:hypothetical protein
MIPSLRVPRNAKNPELVPRAIRLLDEPKYGVYNEVEYVAVIPLILLMMFFHFLEFISGRS